MIKTSLERAKYLQTHLNAFTIFQEENIIRGKAAESQKRFPLSPIDGQLIAVKDNFCTRKLPTTCCSRMLQPFVPTYNATVVEKTEKAGGIVLGKVKSS